MAIHSKRYGKIVEQFNSMKPKFLQWIVHSRKTKDSKLSEVAARIMLLALCIEMAFVIPGLKTGLGIFLDYYYIGSLYIVGLIIIYFIFRKILKLVRIKYASIVGSSVIMGVQTYFILSYMDFTLLLVIIGSALLTIALAGISLLLGAIYLAYRQSMRLALFMLVVSGCGFIILTSINQNIDADSYVSLEEAMEYIQIVPEPSGEVYIANELQHNPADQGPYGVNHQMYRSSPPEAEANDVDNEPFIATSSVDGSEVLQDWSWSKELYWKFTEEEIPINGQLWIPEGEGPFPIVFIMHGNHISEADSSDGYYYLGELLASHGMIVSSIDANFLNYSVWSGIVDNDQVLRTWLMLAHMYTFHELQNEQLNIDWDNVALIGHSRGGQAAAMAVDAKEWLSDSELINILDRIHIKAVIGIAPTDYVIANKLARIRNINYLTIHGTMDSDLTEFFGERQYERTSFDQPQHMKASVAIYNANHGQFNTVWGKYDQQFPGALVLNTSDLIAGEDQRIAAQIYINSFLQASFNMNEQAKALFQDYHVARAWLPSTGYVTRYSSSEVVPLVSFDNDRSTKQLDFDQSMNVSISEIIGRNETSKQNKALSVQWSESSSKLSIEVDYIKQDDYDAFTFSIANIDESDMSEGSSPLPISLQLETKQDEKITVPLQHSFLLLHPAQPDFLKINWLESTIKDGKYNGSLEPLLQTYTIPLSLINQLSGSNPLASLAEISRITFEFQNDTGEIMLDNIGLVTKGGSYVKYNESTQ